MNTDKIMDTLCDVKNRSTSTVFYSIPEDGIRRQIVPGRTIQVKYGELVKLSYQPGGRELMTQFLQIRNAEAKKNLNLQTEIEYNMSEEDIVKLLTVDSLDKFLDALDFAPLGVKDLIKTIAVELPLTDTAKIDALKEKTGFDVLAALKHVAEERAESEGSKVEVQTERRVKADADDGAPKRRVQSTEYKIVD